jgi:hypothetical protein
VAININPTRESSGVIAPDRILRSALGALSDGKVSEVVQQFDDLFTSNDYALAVRRRRPVVLAIVALRRCSSCSNFHFSSLASNFTSGRHLECQRRACTQHRGPKPKPKNCTYSQLFRAGAERPTLRLRRGTLAVRGTRPMSCPQPIKLVVRVRIGSSSGADRTTVAEISR